MLLNSLREFAKKDFLKKVEILPRYQPIIHISEGRLLGFEALSRFRVEGSEIDPIKVFQMANDFDAVGELDCLCRKLALEHFTKNFQGYLFLNVFPSYLTSGNFGKGKTIQLVYGHDLEPNRVVLELTEVERVQDVNLLKKALNYYKSFGFLVGIDDLGTGYNSLKLLLELEGLLDFVKLPKELVKGSARSKIKYQLLKVLSEVSLNIGARAIYEGVEQEEDLKLILHDLKGDYVQGFYFAKPLEPSEAESFRVVLSFKKKKEETIPEGEVPEFINLEPGEKFGMFLNSVKDISSRYVVLILRDEKYLVDLWKLRHGMSEKDKNLYYYKPILEVVLKMENFFPKLDNIPQLTPELLKVHKLHQIMASPDYNLLVIKNEEGIRLLEKHSLLSYLYRKLSAELLHRNPLTQLPGSDVLQEKISELSEGGEDFYVCYIDIDNFKAFNDAYGFYAGDQMIKKVGVILSSFEQRMGGRVFVSHIGGDDFILLMRGFSFEEATQELLRLLSELQEGLLEFYTPEDIEKGYFVGKDREENLKEFPLASVSMALVKGSSHMVDISRKSAQLKKRAKAHKGSALVVENLNQILTIDR
ncbi:MAG: GGDEF domain-containing protein [Aquificaceae bacterium]|nr:GGDEF domain-containing protein [Aquificaceae bacterium]